MFLIAYAAAVIAVPRPIADRPTLGLYVPIDLQCDGPQPPSRLVRDALFPDDEREHLCGEITTDLTQQRYAWTRHAFFAHDGNDWRLLGRSGQKIERAVALPGDRYVLLGEDDVLLGVEHERVLVRDEDLLDRYDVALADARAGRGPVPASPIACLRHATDGSLHLSHSHTSCVGPSSYDLFLSFTSTRRLLRSKGDAWTTTTLGQQNAAVTAIEEAIASRAAARVYVYDTALVAWSCDGVEDAMIVTGARAAAVRAFVERSSANPTR